MDFSPSGNNELSITTERRNSKILINLFVDKKQEDCIGYLMIDLDDKEKFELGIKRLAESLQSFDAERTPGKISA